MTASTTPVHARRAPFGTGLHTAQLIVNGRHSLTHEPYLLNPPGRLHRVDTLQMPAHVDGAAAGACKLPKAQQAHPVEPREHPADADQGHGLDHLYRDHTVSARLGRWLRRVRSALLRRG